MQGKQQFVELNIPLSSDTQKPFHFVLVWVLGISRRTIKIEKNTTEIGRFEKYLSWNTNCVTRITKYCRFLRSSELVEPIVIGFLYDHCRPELFESRNIVRNVEISTIKVPVNRTRIHFALFWLLHNEKCN